MNHQKAYAIYVDGVYVCEVKAVNQMLAISQAQHVPAFQEVMDKKQTPCVVTACLTRGEGTLIDASEWY